MFAPDSVSLSLSPWPPPCLLPHWLRLWLRLCFLPLSSVSGLWTVHGVSLPSSVATFNFLQVYLPAPSPFWRFLPSFLSDLHRRRHRWLRLFSLLIFIELALVTLLRLWVGIKRAWFMLAASQVPHWLWDRVKFNQVFPTTTSKRGKGLWLGWAAAHRKQRKQVSSASPIVCASQNFSPSPSLSLCPTTCN